MAGIFSGGGGPGTDSYGISRQLDNVTDFLKMRFVRTHSELCLDKGRQILQSATDLQKSTDTLLALVLF